MTQSPFPREPDGLPYAWGLTGPSPTEVWERFSPAYEAQAEAAWHHIAALGLTPMIDWAGTQDGEAIMGRDAAGEIAILFHLEDPAEAKRLADALREGRLVD